MKKRVLFLCAANSCRSQMAEGVANHFLSDRLEAFSAGTEASYVNPRAIAVLKEMGIDSSGLRSKSLDEFAGQSFDYVITLCGDANEKCPLYFGGVRRTHIGFPDPARATGAETEVLEEFRKARDAIKGAIVAFFDRKISE